MKMNLLKYELVPWLTVINQTEIYCINFRTFISCFRPDLKMCCWFAVTWVCFFGYTRLVAKKYHFEMEKIALIFICNIFVTKSFFFRNEHQKNILTRTLRQNIMFLSLALSCLYEFDDLTVKSPGATNKYGLFFAILSKLTSKLSAKPSKVSGDWLGEWYSDIELHILPPNYISKFMHSFK